MMSTTQAFLATCTARTSPVTSIQTPSPSPSLNLSIPPAAQRALDDKKTNQRLRDILGRAIHDLRSEYTLMFKRACQRGGDGPIREQALIGLAKILERRFTKEAIPGLMDRHRRAIKDIQLASQVAHSVPVTVKHPQKQHGPFDEVERFIFPLHSAD